MAVSQSCVIWAQYFPRGLPHPCHPYPEPDLAALLAAIPIKAVPNYYSSLKSVLIFPRLRTSIAKKHQNLYFDAVLNLTVSCE